MTASPWRRVGDAKIGVTELQDAARRMLAQVIRQNGGKITPTPEIRREVAQQALQQLIVQAAFAGEVERLRVEVPDAALRDGGCADPGLPGPAASSTGRRSSRSWAQQRLNEDAFPRPDARASWRSASCSRPSAPAAARRTC